MKEECVAKANQHPVVHLQVANPQDVHSNEGLADIRAKADDEARAVAEQRKKQDDVYLRLKAGQEAHNQRRLSTVKNLPSQFPLANLTPAAIQGHIFKSRDRFDSKGRKIPGNGLATTGAIIRRGRKVLIDVDKYGAWLAGNKGGV